MTRNETRIYGQALGLVEEMIYDTEDNAYQHSK